MTAPDLLPCPFCAGAAKTKPVRDGRRVYCQKCEVAGPPVYHGLDGPEATDGHAITAWNTRAATPVNADLLEALRKPFLAVFLDGRNEHGSHVLPCGAENVGCGFQEIQSLLESQEDGIAERIILKAEGAGYEVTQLVVTEWYFDKAETYWDYVGLNLVLTEALCGNSDEQRAIAEATKDEDKK